MLARKALKSRIAEKEIIRIINNAQTFNREKLPVKIEEIGVGGSVLRTENPRDIDIIVRVEFESSNDIEYIKRVIREELSKGCRNPDFHILTSNHSDRWIPSLTVWNRNGYVEINPKDVEKHYMNEFRELSGIVEKIENQDENLPPFFRHSIKLLKSHNANSLEVKFRNYLKREVREMTRLRESRGEIPFDELNTLLRTEMKKFGLAGNVYSEIKEGRLNLEKFARYGLSHEVRHLLKILNLQIKRN